MLNATIQLDVSKIISINISCQHKTKMLDTNTTGRPIIKKHWLKYIKKIKPNALNDMLPFPSQ